MNLRLPVRRRGEGGGENTSERPEDEDEILILLDRVNGCLERDSIELRILDGLPYDKDSVLPRTVLERANDSVLVVLDNVPGSYALFGLCRVELLRRRGYVP